MYVLSAEGTPWQWELLYWCQTDLSTHYDRSAALSAGDDVGKDALGDRSDVP